jgi:hypothetical protein
LRPCSRPLFWPSYRLTLFVTASVLTVCSVWRAISRPPLATTIYSYAACSQPLLQPSIARRGRAGIYLRDDQSFTLNWI